MSKRRKHWSDVLATSACSEGYHWARKQRSLEAAWKNCPKAEWMWWLIINYSDLYETSEVYEALSSNHVYIGMPHSDLTADEFRLLFPFPPKLQE